MTLPPRIPVLAQLRQLRAVAEYFAGEDGAEQVGVEDLAGGGDAARVLTIDLEELTWAMNSRDPLGE